MKLTSYAFTGSRRSILAKLSASSLTLVFGVWEKSAQATIVTVDDQGNVVIRGPNPMPPPQPASLYEMIVNNAVVIYLAKFKRPVWVAEALTKKLIDGEHVDAHEKRLYEAHEIGSQPMGNGYLELTEAKPILLVRTAKNVVLPRGTIYCQGYHTYASEAVKAAWEEFRGKEAIFLFSSNRAWGVEKKLFPEFVYSRAPGHEWRDRLPIPMSELTRVKAIAMTNGLVPLRDHPNRSSFSDRQQTPSTRSTRP